MLFKLGNVEEIKPYPGNPRASGPAVDTAAGWIWEFGSHQPIVVDETGTLVAGLTRFKAALKLGLKTVPVHAAKDLTLAQIKSYRLADYLSERAAKKDEIKQFFRARFAPEEKCFRKETITC